MYELIKLTEKSYYIQSPAKIGLVKLDDKRVCLIDSGNDKEAGRKIRQILDKNGWELTAIYNTHSNADHIGGNKYLQTQTNCKIYAAGIECAFTNYPLLEPSFLYGGYPVDELRHKFLLAQDSLAEPLTPDKLPNGFELIDLPGHFFNMKGFKTPDNVIYLADCLFSRETLNKYKLVFIYDVASYIETLAKVKTMQARIFVPSHAEICEEIAELAQYNIDKTQETAAKILEICSEPLNFEKVLQRLFTEYSLTLNFEQYVLAGSTVKSFLSWLKSEGKIRAFFADNLLLWESV